MKETNNNSFNHDFFTDPKKFARKMWIMYFLILIVISTVSSLLIFSSQKEIESTKSYLGKQAVIIKDTLTIIDYSSFMGTYTLSDGKAYEITLVQSRTLKN